MPKKSTGTPEAKQIVSGVLGENKSAISGNSIPEKSKSVSVNANGIAGSINDLESNKDKWLDPNYKLNRREIQEAKALIKEFNKNDKAIRQGGRNGVVWGETPEQMEERKQIEALSNKVSPVSSFVSGMAGKIPGLLASAAQGILQAGSSDFISDEQKKKGVEAISQARENLNAQQEGMRTQHPIANTLGNFAGTALQYNAVNGALEGTPLATRLADTLGERGANLALGEAADMALDTVPTEVENYQNGMRGADLAKDTALNLGMNAAFNAGAEFIPGLAKNVYNKFAKKPVTEAAEEVIETAAKSAPIEPEPIKQLNPVDLAANNADIEELAYRQQREAADAIQDLANQIPESPVNPVKEPTLFDTVINARQNGTTNTKEAVDAINALQDMDRDIVRNAEKYGNDPEIAKLIDDLDKYRDNSWKSLANTKQPLDVDTIRGHEQALNNLEQYMSEHAPDLSGDIKKNISDSVSKLEMPDDLQKVVNARVKNLDVYTQRINNAKTREEVEGILSEAERMIKDTDNQLKGHASYRILGKYQYDEPTKAFAEAMNGRKLYVSPEMRAEFPDTKLSDLQNRLYFNGADGRSKTLLRANPNNGAAIDTVFSEIDDQTGGALSSFMKNNGLNPDNEKAQFRGIIEYADSLKKTKDNAKVQPYSGGLMDEWAESIRKSAADKMNTLEPVKAPETELKQLNKVEAPEVQSIPNVADNNLKMDIQFFSQKAKDLEKEIAGMEEGAEKDRLKAAVNDFWNKVYGAKSKEEAEEAWNALSKTRTNTMFNSGDFTEYELENIIPESIAKYVTEEETKPYNAALDKIKNDYNGQLEKFTKNYGDDKEVRANLGNAEDINGMYLMIQDLTKRARVTDNFDERVQLYAQARQISRNLIRAERESGRSIQALAKFSRTPERILQRAQGVAEDFVDNALSKNPNLKNDITEVADRINNFLKDVDTAAMTRKEVEDMVNQAILMNKGLKGRLGKGDIQTITNAIMEERQFADIQKTLEFLSTGFREIDGNTMQTVQDMFESARDLPFNSKERVELENEAFKLLANKISPNGGTFRDKLDAWRYLSMLANPTTHLKNMLGNFTFGKGMVSAKNNLAAAIEEAADRVSKLKGKGGIERTKAILTKNDKALVEAAKEDGLENAFRDLSGSKYFDAGKSIDNAIPAFNTKTRLGRFLNKAAKINEGLLSKEDEMAMMNKYKTSLAGYLKANGADASIFKATDEQSKQLLENGRAYAINQAKEAAFHQDAPLMQKFSTLTNDLKHGTKGEQIAGLALDTVVPFKKTPANILKSAFAYSPLEWGKVLTDIKYLKNGADATGKAFKAADFIDDISKAATGSAAFGIGWLLAHEGILKIGSDLSDEEASFDKQTGRQNVALKVGIPGTNIKDVYVPMQELMPTAAPLIFGGTVYETLKNKTDEDTAINTLGAGTGAIANGLIDMSMLSGIADTLMSVRGAKNNLEAIENVGVNAAGNLASQLLPTVGRKTNVTLDDTKRATYSDKKGMAKTIDQEAKYLQTKVPGLQQLGEKMKESDVPALQKAGNRLALQPNIDVKGQVQDSPGVAGNNGLLARAANNFVSPVGNITKDTSTKYDEERRRLAGLKTLDEDTRNKVLPYIGSNEAEFNDRKLNPKEWTEYRKTRGQLREKIVEGIIDSKNYKNMSDADKAALLVEADKFSKNYAQGKFGKELSSDMKNLADVYEKEGVKGFIDTIRFKNAVKDAGNDRQKTKLDIIRNMSREEQKDLLPKAISTKTEQKRWDSVNGNVDKYWQSYDQDRKAALEKENRKKTEEYKASQALKKANISGTPEDIQKELASYGAVDSKTTVEYYTKAKSVIPSLSTKEYAGYLSDIGGSDHKISQKELLSYANNKGLSEGTMNTYWNAFGSWKKIPKLNKNGQWVAK